MRYIQCREIALERRNILARNPIFEHVTHFTHVKIILTAAGAPQDVQMKCFSNDEQDMTYTVITWKSPLDARGTIQGYNVSSVNIRVLPA